MKLILYTWLWIAGLSGLCLIQAEMLDEIETRRGLYHSTAVLNEPWTPNGTTQPLEYYHSIQTLTTCDVEYYGLCRDYAVVQSIPVRRPLQ